MSGFFIHSGNRLEKLAEVLAGLVNEPGSAGVLEPEVVVVPSRGLERWLKMTLARINGVSANLEFPFSQSFLEKNIFSGLRQQIDGQITGDPFSKEMLVWKIFFALEKADGEAAPAGMRFAEIDNYLEHTGDELSRYHLAAELGDLFDRYLLFRPELIRAWERGENPLSQFKAAAWQMELWRDLGRGLPKIHFAALQEAVNQMVYPEFFPEVSTLSLSALQEKLPARLFLFGFAALPFNYLDLFKALSNLIEIHLFHVNPCAEFWGDQIRPGGKKRLVKADEIEGHPLLASWGRLGRAFFNLSASLEVDSYREYFVIPEADTLLAALQRQILELQPPELPLTCNLQDNSLKINLCHGRQREIEILYDTILDALAEDPELKPENILVMAPDIGLYSSYIDARFAKGRLQSGRVRLDYTLVNAESILNLPEIKALFDLLRLFKSRFLLREVFDLFSLEVVRRRFSVSESGLDLLSQWLRRAAVNWGLDGAFREEVSGVDFAENSLGWGLDRLLTGYALAGSDLNDSGSADMPVWADEKGADFLPLTGIEGSEALVLGSFIEFIAILREAHQRLLQPLPARAWRPELKRLLGDFILPLKDDDPGLSCLRLAFEKLDQPLAAVDRINRNLDGDSRDNEKTGRISCETIMAVLERELKNVSGHSGFFSGGITFSSILPLRAVPAEMICLLGLNDGEFPRSQRPSAYDLIAARPMAGDRNARDEDRYLFLETLLAARKNLVLSYLGRDPKDNHLRPPSVVVSELIDYIEDHFVLPEESTFSSMRDFLICDHPPQPFSSRYFNASEDLFSYDSLQAQIATAINCGEKAAPVFFDASLVPVTCDRLKLSELIHFFSNPAKFFLRERLKITPGIKELDHFDDSEPFALDALAAYKFNDDLITHLLAESLDDTDSAATALRLEKYFIASGTLPPQRPGQVLFAEKLKNIRTLVQQLKPYCAENLPLLQKDLILDVSGHEIVIDINLPDLFLDQEGVVRQILYRPVTEVKSKDKVTAAIMNIALGAIASSAKFSPLETRFHTLNDKKSLVLPVGAAESGRAELEILLEFYLEGLSRPLTFLPALSLVWYETWLQESAKKGEAQGLQAADDKVRAELMNERNYAAQDEAYHYVFGDRFNDDDFRSDFSTLARHLGPLFIRAEGK